MIRGGLVVTMGRVFIKGGVWKNHEDEILKVAVMKFGTNQWGRVASFLPRKTAKQCKARWYEWHHPSIKKTEWSAQDEEKLLHLARVLPCQWRTIAPLLGRTAVQCIEHHAFLLDRERYQTMTEEEKKKEEAAKAHMKRADIELHPETRPSLPDAVDLDDQEMETINEARTRIANTRGKKDKRKLRMRVLQQARQMGQLQKRRELTAAGIDVRLTSSLRKGETDYNAAIPAHHVAPDGPYSSGAEGVVKKFDVKDFIGKTIRELEGKEAKSKKDVEAARAAQLEDKVKGLQDVAERAQRRANGGDYETRQQEEAARLVRAHAMKRVSMISRENDVLVLSDPQVSQSDVAAIAKYEKGGASGKALLLQYTHDGRDHDDDEGDDDDEYQHGIVGGSGSSISMREHVKAVIDESEKQLEHERKAVTSAAGRDELVFGEQRKSERAMVESEEDGSGRASTNLPMPKSKVSGLEVPRRNVLGIGARNRMKGASIAVTPARTPLHQRKGLRAALKAGPDAIGDMEDPRS